MTKKRWRYTGKMYAIQDFDWIYFPIGCRKGYGDLKGQQGQIDFMILADGRLAELELAEWDWVEGKAEDA